MATRRALSIIAVLGRAQDERVWGDFLARLPRRYDVVVLEKPEDLAGRTGDVLLATSDATSAAVHAAGNGDGRALVLLAPLVSELLPEVHFDLRARMKETSEMRRLAEHLRAIEDPEQRRSALADGMIRLIGQDIPPADLARLRAMLYDHGDLILDPKSLRPIHSAPCADALATLDVPVLVVAAGGREITAALARALAERAPRGELVLLDTAQTTYPWLAQPDAALAAVTRFLEKL
jgi:hypothetical protein